MARAIDIELYQLFFESKGKKEPQELNVPGRRAMKLSRKDAATVARLSTAVSRMNDRDKKMLVNIARKMAAG